MKQTDTVAPYIRLDAEHRYWVGNPLGECKRVPGFSEIVRELGIVPENPFWTHDGREEGQTLHQWLLFLAQERTASEPPVASIAAKVEGIVKFLRESGFKLKFGEIPQYDPVSRFCTTPDLVGTIGKFLVNIDAKRGGPQKWHPLQLAAQKIALAAGGVRVQKSFSLYLKDGGYKLIEQDTTKHEPRWRQIAATYHIAQEYL